MLLSYFTIMALFSRMEETLSYVLSEFGAIIIIINAGLILGAISFFILYRVCLKSIFKTAKGRPLLFLVTLFLENIVVLPIFFIVEYNFFDNLDPSYISSLWDFAPTLIFHLMGSVLLFLAFKYIVFNDNLSLEIKMQ